MTTEADPTVRDATEADVDVMVELFHRERLQYQEHSPVFWRVAANDRQSHRPFLAMLVDSPDVVTLVAGGGALIALDRGPVLMTEQVGLTAGAVSGLLAFGVENDVAVVVVPVAADDDIRRTLLRDHGFGVASEWNGPT